ncbi:hypothetical protein RN629_18265, partial [Sphingomonadaceae bacterium jetA1]|uniref:hypothetical protein n=1 Tax=Facivitalis istanbulensis TaxID=3075838 RepID=UPI003469682E
PALQIALPILFHRQPPSKLAPYESCISLTGNPKNHTSAKVVIAFCTLLWPEIVEFEGYVLRGPLDIERLRAWEHHGDLSRQQIETAMNAYLLDEVFPQDTADAALKSAQCDRLLTIMADMLEAKLTRDFPERVFSGRLLASAVVV